MITIFLKRNDFLTGTQRTQNNDWIKIFKVENITRKNETIVMNR